VKLLDLYCGIGGAAVGYSRAGFDEITGVDIVRKDDYPFDFILGDASEYLKLNGKKFDLIHASPPCQAYTSMSNRWRGKGGKADSWVKSISAIRKVLISTGVPFVIENVGGAAKHLICPVRVSGGCFGLRVDRPRYFESSFFIQGSKNVRVPEAIGVYGRAPDGRRLYDRKDGSVQYAARSVHEAAEVMGIDWTLDWRGIAEAVPPAYTEFIGRQIIEIIDSWE
jgi:Site-specific DNA methylase